MNDTIRMQISAFVDGELPENESELLLRRLSQDTEFRQVFAQYLQVGRLLRRDDELPQMSRLRGRIAEALGDEIHTHELPDMQGSRNYVKPLAGFAVAATVALLAIFSLQQANVAIVTDPGIALDDNSYTQRSADLLLDEMFRRHENSPLIERVNYDFDAAVLIEVESQAAFETPIEAEVEIDEKDEEQQIEQSRVE